jgi:hypothetical protein
VILASAASHCVLSVNVRHQRVEDVYGRNATLQDFTTLSSHVSSYVSALQNLFLPLPPLPWQRVTGKNYAHHMLPNVCHHLWSNNLSHKLKHE